jgi:tetratricopeptide (TPR) repeat protein
MLAGWLAATGRIGRREDPGRLWEQARAAWSSGRLDEAEALLDRLARRRRPPTAERLLWAQVARERGQFDRALEVLEEADDHGPEAAVIWRTRGLLEFDRDHARPAEEALIRALALDPGLADAHRDLVNIYTIKGQRPELEAHLRALADAGPLSFSDLYLWCLGRRLEVGPAELADRLGRMLDHDPGDRQVRLALAEDLRRLGHLDEAGTALAPLGEADPQALAARALLALDRGRLDEANELLARGPGGEPDLERLRGRLALAGGDRAAVGHYRAALAASPDDRDCLFGLGQALRLAGQAEAARPLLKVAQDRARLEWLIQNACSPSKRDDPAVLREIGDQCRMLQQLPQARSWYRLALARDPSSGELQARLFEVDAALSREQGGAERTRPRG